MFNVANSVRREIAVQKNWLMLPKNLCFKIRVCDVLPESGRYTEMEKVRFFREPVSELVILANATQKFDPNKFIF